MIEEQGWILNNDIIWKKTSATPTSFKKRLTNSYEHFYHFVKNPKFYYNLTTLNAKKNKPKVIGDVIKTSSNVTGVNYNKIINQRNKLLKDVLFIEDYFDYLKYKIISSNNLTIYQGIDKEISKKESVINRGYP